MQWKGASSSLYQVSGYVMGKEEIGVSKRNIEKAEGCAGEAHHSPSFSVAFVSSAEQEEGIGVSKRNT